MAPRRALRVLISSGPTRERIDPVRFLSNDSTGYMGARFAAEILRRGHRVTVVSGPGTEPLPGEARVIRIETAAEMERALRAEAGRSDVIIMAAAVADFRPVRPATAKLPRRAALVLRLRPTADILGRLPRRGQCVVGFALESRDVVERGRRKLREKRLDFLLAQQVNGHGAPFGRRPVRAWLMERGGAVHALGTVSKPAVARLLLDKIEALWYGQHKHGRHPGGVHN